MKYLFCTDGSSNSFSALEGVFGLLKAGSVVDIFYVIQSKKGLTSLNNYPNGEDKSQKIFKKSKRLVEKHAHVLGEFFVEHGDVKNIIEHVKKVFYNMVILGSNDYKGFRNRIFGFARKILEKTSSPVFIYHNLSPKKERAHKKVLLCVDDSYATLNAVISFMRNFNQKNDITLLSVESQISSHSLEIYLNGASLDEAEDKEIELFDKNMSGIENILCHNNIIVKSKIHLRGNPSDEILNFAKQDFDLVVLGSHSKEGLVGLLLGSVSKNIADYVEIPILIIPTKAS